jgi:phospholipid/cholesterol/gamma-HCH transport system permease protein
VIASIGKASAELFADIHSQVAFFAQVLLTGLAMATHPWRFRWKDFLVITELAGFRALEIISLLGFLFGLIIAFSSAMPLRQFGVEIYVADLVAIALVRVLGPFITAIIVAGRTGSAYAAEIGTMKINNEIDALEVMNLDPVGFLVLPRVLAATLVTPLLTVIANLWGLIGSGLVIVSLGYPVVTYLSHVQSILSPTDVMVGLVKALVYGALVGMVGCLRGLQTQLGAGAVGIATTRAVVTAIILLVITEGVFSVLLHFLEL